MGLAIGVIVAGAFFVGTVDIVRELDARLAATLVGDGARWYAPATVLVPPSTGSGTFVVRVTGACSTATVLFVLIAAAGGLRASPVRRVVGLACATAVAALVNQARLCSVIVARRLWGERAGFLVHDWAGTTLTLVASALGVVVLLRIAALERSERS